MQLNMIVEIGYYTFNTSYRVKRVVIKRKLCPHKTLETNGSLHINIIIYYVIIKKKKTKINIKKCNI